MKSIRYTIMEEVTITAKNFNQTYTVDTYKIFLATEILREELTEEQLQAINKILRKEADNG